MMNNNYKDARILIVDDQEANIEVLADLLEMEEYINVRSLSDSRQALAVIRTWKPDILLLDLMMPYFSGFDIMRMIKETITDNEYLPILVLTADISTETKQKALAQGASDFVSKPFELVEVVLRMNNLLQTRYLFRQIQNQNLLLDQKVKVRTEELELINEKLKNAYEKVEASDRFKSTLINTISHEVRTPLNGILGFSEILAENTVSIEEKKLFLSKIYESSHRLIKTITDFIDISNLMAKSQSVVRKKLSPDLLIKQVVDDYSKISLQKKIPVIPDFQNEAEISLLSDSEILRKILSNLLDNALKFTHKGKVRIGFKQENERLRFFIEDTGIGIAKDKIEEIFKAFVQEDSGYNRSFDGNGLGLTIAQNFVELLEGTIWIESEKGVGTKVFFEVPGVITKKEPVIGTTNEKQDYGLRYTILVVEDDTLNYLYMSHLLDKPNVELIHAKDGFEAVNHAKTREDISLILMDLRMPGMDGFTATRQIKQLLPEVPLIAVTAYSGIENEKKAREAGCDDILLKPTKHEHLYKKLAQYSVIVE